jgi:hypothetical protein
MARTVSDVDLAIAELRKGTTLRVAVRVLPHNWSNNPQ